MHDRFAPQGRDDTARLILMFQAGVVLIFFSLGVTFWNFQVGQYARLSELAEINHQRTLNLRAPRGIIFDRNYRVLVENRYSLNVSLVRERVGNLDQALALLAAITDVDLEAIYDVIEKSTSIPEYLPVVIIRDASLGQVAAVIAHRRELPGFVVEEVPTRYYPSESLASHSFGYVGQVTVDQLQLANDDRLKSGSIVGRSGLEQEYNELLMGQDGARRVAVNSTGREIEVISEVSPDAGRQLQLTLDYDLQLAGEAAFEKEGYKGAAVALDPNSGDILALVSLPGYDPNDFAVGIDDKTWSSLNDDALRPLQNRALQGRYPPGSTFKVVMAAAALEEGVIDLDFSVPCRGGGTYFGRFYRCHSTHGMVNLDIALEKSCNSFFYEVGSMLDVDVINRWANTLGLGVLSGIDLPHEALGIVPSRSWKREQFGEPWYPGETISVSIGQGALAVTPLSLAVMMATVSNGGTRVVPRLLKAVREQGVWQDVEIQAPTLASILSVETIEAIRRGLWMVVNRQGTGSLARIDGRDIIGKSGTAQVVSLATREAATGEDDGFRDHGWFIFAAPRDNPKIAGVIFAENADDGAKVAPIARHIIETFFAKESGEPLPSLAPIQVSVPVQIVAEG